jgi:hypothetical protein
MEVTLMPVICATLKRMKAVLKPLAEPRDGQGVRHAHA